jgi:hypothetical protein
MRNEKIRVIFVFEIMGRPAEYIVQGLEHLINKLAEINGVELVNRKIHEPKLIENGNGLYTTFADVEIIVEKIDLIFLIMFNIFPSHVEIIEPEEIKISNLELGSVMSELALKLHRYEQVTKGLTGEREIFIKRLNEIDPEFLKQLGSKSIQEAPKKETKETKKVKKKKI